MPAASDKKSDFTSVLVACCLAMLAVGDNSTAIMAALPAMRGDLQLAPRQKIHDGNGEHGDDKTREGELRAFPHP